MDQGWNLNNTGIDVNVSIFPYLLMCGLERIHALAVHHGYNPWAHVRDVIFVKGHMVRPGVFTVTRVSLDGFNRIFNLQLPEYCSPVSRGTENVRILRRPLQEIHTLVDESREWIVYLETTAEISRAAYQHPHSNIGCVGSRSWQKT